MNVPEREDAPILLPSPATRSAATGLGTSDVGAIPALIPALHANNDGGDADTELADRIESVLAEDGRFRAIIIGLQISAAAGSVTLGGAVPDALRASLLATVHAVPGVQDVQADFS